MGSMVAGRRRVPPPVVLMYAILQVGVIAYGLTKPTELWHHAVAAAALIALLALWLAAIVVWRQRWAWGAAAVVYSVGLIEPAWRWHGALIYICDVAMLVLLLSPHMREYVGVARRRATPDQAYPGGVARLKARSARCGHLRAPPLEVCSCGSFTDTPSAMDLVGIEPTPWG